MSRIRARFAKLKDEGRAGLVTFTMAYDPTPEASLDILKAIVASGADMVEIGVPFSDPMADGKIIQAAGIRALKHGATLKKILALVAEFRKTDADTPIILMGYYNPFYIYGAEKFAKDARSAGVDGVILVDLPPEEESEYIPHLKTHNITPVRLIAPTSLESRLPKLLEQADGFVYYISVLGVTGTKSAKQTTLDEDVGQLRKATSLPVCVGFGIKTPEQAKEVAALADGVVVGSALVDVIGKAATPKQAIEDVSELVASFATTIRSVKKPLGKVSAA